MTEAQARNALDMAGFGVNVSYQENDSVTEGTVISWNPSGKQNSFAGNVLPSAMLVECKEQKIPTSMVNAFVEPVRPNQDGDLVYNSIVRLASEADMLSRNYGLEVTRRLWFCVDKYQVTPECQTECCESLPALIQAVEEEMN